MPMFWNTQVNPAHPPAPNPTVDTLVFMLNECGLDEHLHDRALYVANKQLWRDGYLRGRPLQNIAADLVIKKAHIQVPSDQRSNLRDQIIQATFQREGFNLPAILSFMTWAEKANHPNHPNRLQHILEPSPINAAQRRDLLAYLFSISFDISQADAYANVERLQKRELDEIRNMTVLVGSNALTTGVFAGITFGASTVSSLSFGARNALFAKASVAGLKIKLILVPMGAVGSVVGVASGAVGAIGTVYTGIFGICTAYRTACLGLVMWRDRFEISRSPLRDAAILGVISALNDQVAQQVQISNEIEKDELAND